LKKIAVIVAGGSGNRMLLQTPKQFMIIHGKPLLFHTLNVFARINDSVSIVLVLPEKHIELWRQLCEEHKITIAHTIVSGGPTRFHSVKSGLKECDKFPDDSVVAIHDGVRPFVSEEVIKNGFEIAARKGSAIPVVPIIETIREVSGSLSKTVPREKYCLVQTPQFFHLPQIIDAYRIPYSETFTDDAAVFETSGRQVHLIDGNRENVKITQPSDILMAETLFEILK